MSEYQVFVDHFSSPTISTGVFLQDRLSKLHSPATSTVTQDNNFNLVRFAEDQKEDLISLERTDDTPSIRAITFEAPKRRREGDGKVQETVDFACYKTQWKGESLSVVKAKWFDPRCGQVTQWHLVGHAESAKNLILHCCSWCSAASTRNAILVFDRGSWRSDKFLWDSVQTASWDDVVLDETLKTAIKRDYKSFFQSEAIYKNFQVPWKRGLILLGPPGNGKTVSMKAIMQDAGVPSLYVKSFKNPNGDEYGIRQIFSRARAEAPCVLVLEDLDSLVTQENRSFFLNEVDGLEDNDGMLLIGTTNHFEKLDPALSNRPSRFDRKYVFPAPTESERRQYAAYWQKKLAQTQDIAFPTSLVDDVAAEAEGLSFAYLKEVFVSALLSIASFEGRAAADLPTFPEAVVDQIKFLKAQLDAGEEAGMAASWVKGTTSEPDGGVHMMAARRIRFG